VTSSSARTPLPLAAASRTATLLAEEIHYKVKEWISIYNTCHINIIRAEAGPLARPRILKMYMLLQDILLRVMISLEKKGPVASFKPSDSYMTGKKEILR
jgi:hypothetical protein